MKIRILRNKWCKWLFRIIGSLMVIIIILALIFEQATFIILGGVGILDIHYGNNERGNKIMYYAFSKIDKPDAYDYHEISVQNTKNGNYNFAIPALEKAYKLDPENIGAYYGWVLLYYYHEYEKSLSILKKYDNSTPGFSDWPMGECIHYLKGLAHMQLKDYGSAIKEFDISIENTASEHGENWVNFEVFINKGRCLAELKKYTEAIISYQKAINNCNKCSEPYYFMGISQIMLFQNENACQNLNKAYELIKKGYKSSDAYVELFHEIYEQQIIESISNNCINQ